MTKFADLEFPTTATELAGLGSDKLNGLIGKLGKDTLGVPTSISYFLDKPGKIALIQKHHFGHDVDVSQQLSDAQAKYAAHTAKGAAKAANKAQAASQMPVVPGSNCSATLGKQLIEAAATPNKVTEMFANLGAQIGNESWAYSGLGPDSAKAIHKSFLTFEEALVAATDEETSVAYAMSVLADVALSPAETVAQAKALLGDMEGVLNILNSDSIAPLSIQAAAKGTATELGTKLNALSGGALDNTKAIALANDVFGSPNLFIEAYAEATSMDLAAGLAKFTDLDFEGYVNTFTSLLENHGVLVSDFPEEALQALGGHLAQMSKTSDSWDKYFFGNPDTHENFATALTQATQHNASALAKLANEAKSGAYDEAYAKFIQMPLSELQKLAGDATVELGHTQSLGKYFLFKGEDKATFLAKKEAGLSVEADIAKAQENYVTHQATQKAKKKAANSPEALGIEEAEVSAVLVGPEVSSSTILSAEDALALAKANPESAAFAPLDKVFVSEDLVPNYTYDAPSGTLLETKFHKPAQVEHKWTYIEGQKSPGGTHAKELFSDEDGFVWMWKKADPGVGEVEVLAHEVGWELGFDLADIRKVEGWQTKVVGKAPHGTLQKFHVGVRGDIKSIGLDNLTAEQIQELQGHQVFDWLLSQHDSHAENILIGHDGHIIPIDKGQAWKFLGKDRLSTSYVSPAGRSVYNDLWDQVLGGGEGLRSKVDFNAIDDVLRRVENMSEARWAEIVDRVTAAKFGPGAKGVQFLSPDVSTEEKFRAALHARRATLRDDFTKYYADIAKRAGMAWEPAWGKTAPKVVRKTVKKSKIVDRVFSTTDVMTPIDADFVASVQATGALGRPLHLAGEHINGGTALVFEELDVGGASILRLELNLEREADSRLAKMLADKAGYSGAVPGMPTLSTAPAYVKNLDSSFNSIMAAAKTANTHVGDGNYNVAKLATMAQKKTELQAYVAIAEQADTLLSEGLITAAKWAEAKTTGAVAENYLSQIKSISIAVDTATKAPFAVKIDASKVFDDFALLKKDGTKQVAKSSTEGLFDGDVTTSKEFFHITKPVSGRKQLFRRTGKTEEVITADHGGAPIGTPIHPSSYGAGVTGDQFNFVVDVEGTKVKLTYRSWSMTSAQSSRGLLGAEVVGWDGSAAALEKIRTAVDRLGVSMQLATEEDEALTYWRLLTRTMKERKLTGSGFQKAIPAIEERLAKGINARDEIAIYVEEYTKVFGSDAVAKAAPRILHDVDYEGTAIGRGFVERFDLPDDMSDLYLKDGVRVGLAHGIPSRRVDADFLLDFGGAVSGQDLVRFGQYGQSGATTSLHNDMHTGGGTSVFFSQGFSEWQKGRDVFVVNPSRVMRRASTTPLSVDSYGAFGERFKAPAKGFEKFIQSSMAGRNETTIRGTSLASNIEIHFVRSGGNAPGQLSRRSQILKELTAQGITEIRGISIGERIVEVLNDQDVIRKTDEFFRKYPELYRQKDSDIAAVFQGVRKSETVVGNTSAAASIPDVALPKGLTATEALAEDTYLAQALKVNKMTSEKMEAYPNVFGVSKIELIDEWNSLGAAGLDVTMSQFTQAKAKILDSGHSKFISLSKYKAMLISMGVVL